ncbi:hypothetical protein BDR03DRAFT_873303 [Suillus americanus]|nr:hypothetical protein BDR03DRAFT_873303 [Suillus americanus]
MTVGSEVSNNTLKLCANLFSSNYGIWGDQTATISKFTVARKWVKMTGARLQSQCLSHPESSVLSEHPQLYRHTFATVWDYGENKVGWVMQLVVNAAVHQYYITTHLLQALKCHALFGHVNIVGLISSHPAACNALEKYAGELSPSLY